MEKNDKYILLNPKCIYVLKAIDGSVKVGITSDFTTRLRNIQSGSGKIIEEYYHTDKCSNASAIESKIKQEFADSTLIGEWFHCDYNSMKLRVEELYLSMATHKFVTEEEFEKRGQIIIDTTKKIWKLKEEKDKSYELFTMFRNAILLLIPLFAWSDYRCDGCGDDLYGAIVYINEIVHNHPQLFNDDEYLQLIRILDNMQNIKNEMYRIIEEKKS